MKIVGGCFGCLAFLFLILAVAWGVIATTIATMLPPEVWGQIGPFFGYGQYLNSGCCCLSSALAIGLLAFSSSRSREPIE